MSKSSKKHGKPVEVSSPVESVPETVEQSTSIAPESTVEQPKVETVEVPAPVANWHRDAALKAWVTIRAKKAAREAAAAAMATA